MFYIHHSRQNQMGLKYDRQMFLHLFVPLFESEMWGTSSPPPFFSVSDVHHLSQEVQMTSKGISLPGSA